MPGRGRGPSAGHGRRPQPAHLALGRAGQVLGPHHRVRGAPRPNHDLLRPDRHRRRLEDRGRRHPFRADLRQIRQHEHGLPGHRPVQSQHPLPGHGRADARPVERPRQRRLEIDGRRQDLDEDRPGEELFHPQGRGRLQEPRHRLCRGRGQALRQRDGLRARPLQDRRRRQDLDQRVWPLKDRGVGDFVVDPRNSDVVIAAAYKTYRRTWTYHRPPAGQQPLQDHRRRQDLEEADRRPAGQRRARPDRPGRLREEPEHRSTPGSTRRSTSAWPSATAGPTSGRPAGSAAAARRRRALRRGLHLRQVQDFQDQPRHGQGGAQVHADRRGRTRPTWSRSSTSSSATRTS